MKLYIKVVSENPNVRKYYEHLVKRQNAGGGEFYDSGIDLIFPENDDFLIFKKENCSGVILYNFYLPSSSINWFPPHNHHQCEHEEQEEQQQKTVSPDEILTKLVDLGIQCAAYTNEGSPCGFYLYPRSSIFKTPFRMANSTGIIDSGYRGNIKAPLDLFASKVDMRNLFDGERIGTKEGERMFQICAGNLEEIRVELVDELPRTSRGSGGFGSTGV